MGIKTRATIEDLYKVEGKAELVNGEIVEMPPSRDEPIPQVSRLRRVSKPMHDVLAEDGPIRMVLASMSICPTESHLAQMLPIMSECVPACAFWKGRLFLPSKSAARTTMVRQQNGRCRGSAPITSPAGHALCGTWTC